MTGLRGLPASRCQGKDARCVPLRNAAQTSGIMRRRVLRGSAGVAVFAFFLGCLWVAGSPPGSKAVEPRSASLPAGTLVYLRLETAVSSKTSHLHDPVVARVVREVPCPAGIAIPLGGVVKGHIERLIPSSSPAERARVLLWFTDLEISGQPSLKIHAHLSEVENARESVLPDGSIQGVLASELPLTYLENAVAKLGKSNAGLGEKAQKTQAKILGKSDTSIDYPKGTDLAIVLDQPLEVGGVPSSAVPEQLSASVATPVDQLLAGAPQRASGKDGKPGDPLNLVVIGNAQEIRRVFQEAGWSEAVKATGKTVWETVRAVAGDRGYGAAPVSQLYLFGRAEDLAFEKMLNTFARRHHLRLWRSPVTTQEGREIWLGAATHDSGLDVRPGVVSHAIDPDLDAERAKVGADLVVTGLVAVERLVTRPDPLQEGLTATGAPWKTDGRLVVLELKAQ